MQQGMLRQHLSHLGSPWLALRPCFASIAAQPVQQATDQRAAVVTELSSAGVPLDTIDKVLRRYPSYARWDVPGELRPAIQLWTAELGQRKLADKLHAQPQLLRRLPSDMQRIVSWLKYLGVPDPDRMLDVNPMLLQLQLEALQKRAAVLREFGIKDIGQLVWRHPVVLTRRDLQLHEVWQTLADLLQFDVNSADVENFLTSLRVSTRSPFDIGPALLLRRMGAFLTQFGSSYELCRRGIIAAVYTAKSGTMQHRAAALKTMLKLTHEELRRLITKQPKVLTSQTETIKANVESMLRLGFSMPQVSAVSLACPALLGGNCQSNTFLERWSFLTQVVHYELDFIVAHPQILIASVKNMLGPQYAYIKHLHSCGVHSTSRKPLADVVMGHGPNFLAVVTTIKLPPMALKYDAQFKAGFQLRWQYLAQQQGIAVRDIGLHQDVLNASLCHVLGPRIHFLQLVVAQHADFCLVDQLTNVATMSDQDFAAAYNQLDFDLAYTADYIKDWQCNNAHVWQNIGQ